MSRADNLKQLDIPGDEHRLFYKEGGRACTLLASKLYIEVSGEYITELLFEADVASLEGCGCKNSRMKLPS
jgi:hypothetical protein